MIFRKRKKKLQDLETIDEDVFRRYYWLLVQAAEFDRKVRLTSIRLSRKYEKHQPWIV